MTCQSPGVEFGFGNIFGFGDALSPFEHCERVEFVGRKLRRPICALNIIGGSQIKSFVVFMINP